MSAWRIHRTKGYTMSHPVIATAPGCPDERHPTRDCGCRVFRTEAAARAYVESLTNLPASAGSAGSTA